MKLRMGTRGSALALAQSGWLVRQLKALEPSLEVETVVIKTSGDGFSVEGFREAREKAQTTKGLFVKEIEEALQRGEVDFAVHSAKDLPSELAPGLHIGAYPQREDARDVFIGRGGLTWNGLRAGHKVATASLRRSVQLKLEKPGVETVSMRGNVDTRLRKLEEGAADGLLLAAAGLKRLGRGELIGDLVPPHVMVPAPGQGALAVELKEGPSDAFELIERVDDEPTRLAVELERAFLAAVGGGCSTPLGAHAVAADDLSTAKLSVFWSKDDGTGEVRFDEVCPDLSRPRPFAEQLAAKVRRSCAL